MHSSLTFEDLPDDSINVILFLLEREDLQLALRVSKRLLALSSNAPLWRSLLKRDFDISTTSSHTMQIYLLCHLLKTGEHFAKKQNKLAKAKAKECFEKLEAELTKLTELSKTVKTIDTALLKYLWGALYNQHYESWEKAANNEQDLDKKDEYFKKKLAASEQRLQFLLDAAAATKPSPAAMFLLSKLGLDKGNYWLKRAVECHHREATFRLAISTNFGHLWIKADHEEYKRLLKENIAQGHAQSAHELAKYFDAILFRDLPSGSKESASADTDQLQVTHPRIQEIIDAFELAMELGDPEAALWLYRKFSESLAKNDDAVLYGGKLRIYQFPRDATRAVDYLKKAVELKSAEAAAELGELLGGIFSHQSYRHFTLNHGLNLLNVQRNIPKAIKNLELAIKYSNYYDDDTELLNRCVFALLDIYRLDSHDTKRDEDKMIYWLQRGAEKGSLKCAIELVELSLSSVPKNLTQAAIYSRRACEISSPPDIEKIAYLYNQSLTRSRYLDEAVLPECLKWNVRGVFGGSSGCTKFFRKIFIEYLKPRSLVSQSSAALFSQGNRALAEREFDEPLASLIKGNFDAERQGFTTEEAKLLLTQCCQVLGLKPVDDSDFYKDYEAGPKLYEETKYSPQ